MSFILDALRKSEHERQRRKAPDIAQVHASRRDQKRSIWLPVVALLVGINLSLVALLWFNNDEAEPETAVSRAPVPINPVREAPTRVAPAAPINDGRSRDLQSEFEPAAVVSKPTPAPAPAAQPSTQTKPVTSGLIDMPTYTQMMLDGEISFALNMDVHVYSDNPAERFVFINTTRYREGEQLSEGPEIREINELGVVLNHQGRNFLLARD